MLAALTWSHWGQPEATQQAVTLLALFQCLLLLLCLLLLAPGLQHGLELVLGAGLNMLKEVLGSDIIHDQASQAGIVQQSLPDRTALHGRGRGFRTSPYGHAVTKQGFSIGPHQLHC